MIIKYEDIDRIINILNEAKNNIKPGEYYTFENKKLKKNDFTLPEKWYIKVTVSNVSILNEFLRDNKKHYKDYNSSWKVNLHEKNPAYFHFPQAFSYIHSNSRPAKDYVELSNEQFEIIQDKYLPF